MNCSKNGVKRKGESCTLNNNCIYPKCLNERKCPECLTEISIDESITFGGFCESCYEEERGLL